MHREIYKIDAAGQAPGRLAARVSLILQGKNKPDWDPAKDTGGFVHIENAGKIKITGKKSEYYPYYTHSRYPGGLKKKIMKDVSPEFIIRHAILKMLPRNRHRTERIKRVKFV